MNISSNSNNEISEDELDNSDELENFDELQNSYEGKSIDQSINNSFTDSSKFWYFIFGLLAVILSSKYVLYTFVPNYNSSNQKNCLETCSEYLELRNKFPNQNKYLWFDLKVGVESVCNHKPTKPTVFMILYTNHSIKYNEIMESIVSTAYSCFGAETKPIHVTYKDLMKKEFLNDFGNAIVYYKPLLEKSKILFVENFEKIPPSVARMFHSICDLENPLVKDSIIFLTMKIDLDIEIEQKQTTAIAEKMLVNLWKNDLKYNILDPLIGRVTDQVLFLK